MLVVLQHFQHLLAPPERAPFDRVGLGIVAVAVFFVVSGFVVAEANSVFYPGRPGAFLANRLVRLVPPYAAATREAGGWRQWDRRLGNLSYPLYLNHYVVGIAMADLVTARGVAHTAAAIILAVVGAAAMDALVDDRLVTWRDRIRRVRLQGRARAAGGAGFMCQSLPCCGPRMRRCF